MNNNTGAAIEQHKTRAERQRRSVAAPVVCLEESGTWECARFNLPHPDLLSPERTQPGAAVPQQKESA
jgi:hypothetical protein